MKKENLSGQNNSRNSSNSRQDDFFDFDLEPPARSFSNREIDRKVNTKPPTRQSRIENNNNLDYDFNSFDSGRKERPPVNQSDDYQRPTKRKESVHRQQQERNQNNRQVSRDGDDGVQYRNKEELRRAQYIRRKKRQKKNKIVGIISLVLIVAIVTVVLSLTVFFKISSINIVNNNLYSEEQILRMIDFNVNENMFMIGKSKQEANIASKLPYIKSAKITYKLPSTVVITVTETTAKYFYKVDDAFYLLDEDLVVLEGNVTELPEGVAEIQEVRFKPFEIAQKAVVDDEKTAKQMNIIVEALKKTDLDKITAVKPVNESTNFLVYDGRINIKLGSLTNLEYKLTLAKSGIDKENEKSPDIKGTLDVTVDKQARFTAEQ